MIRLSLALSGVIYLLLVSFSWLPAQVAVFTWPSFEKEASSGYFSTLNVEVAWEDVCESIALKG